MRRKGKEPVHPSGYDEFISSISHSGNHRLREDTPREYTPVSLMPDASKLPEGVGVRFNKHKGTEGVSKAKKDLSKKKKKPAHKSSSLSSESSDSSEYTSDGDPYDPKKDYSKKARKQRKRERRKARREETHMLKRVKVEAPSQYDGKADLDVFDHWTLEVESWKDLNRLTDHFVITLLNKYLTGKAGVFYMKYVAGFVKTWTLPKIYDALFEYCFPRD
jgi:hypothetical protein